MTKNWTIQQTFGEIQRDALRITILQIKSLKLIIKIGRFTSAESYQGDFLERRFFAN
jgi:hypothetical protein